jgi:hypothetical protein
MQKTPKSEAYLVPIGQATDIYGLVVVVVVVDEPGGGDTTIVAGAGWTTTPGGCTVRSSVQEKQPLAMTQTPRAINKVKARWLIENMAV